MAIIALIIAELLEYRWHVDLVRLRNYHWQQELYELLDAALTGSSASSPADFRAELPLLLCLALPLLALILLLALISWLLGDWIMLPASVLLLLFCFGPADLQSLYHHLRSSDQQQRQQSLRRLLEQARANAAPDSANTTQTLVTAMFLPALQGWFTIIFWFVASALWPVFQPPCYWCCSIAAPSACWCQIRGHPRRHPPGMRINSTGCGKCAGCWNGRRPD